MLASRYASSGSSAAAVSVVLIPAVSGRQEATKPIVSLPQAIHSRIATSSGAARRDLSSATSDWIAQPLATSPAARARLSEGEERLDRPAAPNLARGMAADAVGDRRQPRARVDGILVVGPPP